jgi:DNA modification methylase
MQNENVDDFWTTPQISKEFEEVIELETISNKIIIDDEIKNRLWKLNDTEQENLKQSIVNEGCRESLILWNNILIDGHNRYQICKDNNIEFTTISKIFNNKNEVLKWIDTNQLSRRNLLDWQRDIILGRLSKQNKLSEGNSQLRQNVLVGSQQTLANDLNVSTKTLQRNEKFVDAYDDIERNVGKDKAVEIVSKMTKQDVINISKEEPFKQEELINKIISNEVKNLKEAKKVDEINIRRNNTVTTNNNLHLGDCVEVLKTLDSNSVDCVVMDPPYAISYKDTRESFNPEFEDDPEVILPMLKECFKELKRVCKTNAHIYCFFGMSEYINFYNLLNDEFGENVERIPLIWAKNNHTMCDFNTKYALKYEPIFFISNKERKLNYPVSPDVLQFSIPTNKLHKTQKPIDLCEYLIKNSTVEGEVVLDPFMGSGTSCLAAKNIKRQYIGIEKSEDIYNIAKERLS